MTVQSEGEETSLLATRVVYQTLTSSQHTKTPFFTDSLSLFLFSPFYTTLPTGIGDGFFSSNLEEFLRSWQTGGLRHNYGKQKPGCTLSTPSRELNLSNLTPMTIKTY